jgi:hypothetical protein
MLMSLIDPIHGLIHFLDLDFLKLIAFVINQSLYKFCFLDACLYHGEQPGNFRNFKKFASILIP